MDAPLNSYHRSFDAMWRGVETALLEAQHDANAQSIKDDLKKGPSLPKKALTAPTKEQTKGKGGKDSKSPGGKGPTHVHGKGDSPKPKKDNKSKHDTSSKDKGSGSKGSGNQVKSLTPEEKAASPCIYHLRGRCMRGDQCPYSHAANPKAKANPQGTSPHAPAGAKVTAAVAIMASVSQAAATLPSSTQVCLDYVGDTGAGECLGSVEAFRRQGFDIPDELITSTNHPVQFLTGGGSKAGTSTIGFWSQEFERMSNVYLLPQCPLALSIGQLCQEGYTFLWSGQSLPMLIPPSTQFDYMVDGPVLSADRVEHNVPIFRLSIECTYGMPASASSSAAGPPPDVPVGGG